MTLAALYPFEGRRLDLGGLSLHYLDEGAGDPVLMVHGNPSWSFTWRKLVGALRGGMRCVVPDHIGCGRSDKPGDDRYEYTLARRIDDLTALVEHLDLRRVTLVCHDWGGAIGCGWAVRQPERVARLVLMNTAAFPLPPGKRVPPSLRLARTPGLGALLVRGFSAFTRGANRYGVVRGPLPAEVAAGYHAPYDSWAHRIAVHRFVQDIPFGPGDRAWETLTATAEGLPRLARLPTLLVWGLADFVFDAPFLAEWRRRLPHAEVLELPDAGHYLMEDAGDEVLDRVTRFLDEHPLP